MKRLCCLMALVAGVISAPVSGNAAAAPAARIPGKYIVVLAPQAVAEAVAARHGAALEAKYTHALHGFAAAVPAARLAALQNDPEVALVEPDVIVQAVDVIVAGGDSPML